MKILVVTSEFGEVGGGLSTACSRYVELLKKIDVECKVHINELSFEKNNNENDYIVLDGGYKKELKKQLYYGGLIKTLAIKYRNEKFDYVIAFGAEENSFFAAMLADALQIKLIVLIRGSDVNLAIFNEKSYYYNYFCFSKADCVVGLSNELIDNSKRIYESNKAQYFVIPNAYDIEVKEQSTMKKNNKRIVIGTGAFHLNEKKGVGNLIKVISFLNYKFKEYKWDMELVGEIDKDLEKNYRELAKKLNIENSIIMLGGMSREMFNNKISEWDLYIQGSVYEGYSNSVVEAISNGTPVLLSDTGFFAENLKEKYPEIIFNSFLPNDIAEIVHDFLNNKKKELIVRNYTSDVQKLINTEEVCRQWREVFMFLADKKNIQSVMFHDVNNSYTGVDYAIEGFENLIRLTKNNGYVLCSSKEYFASTDRKNKIICTFDDGYKGVYENAFPIMNKYEFTATVFVCPDLIGKQNDWNHKDPYIRKHMDINELNTLASSGWEIGSHGLNHVNLKRYNESELIEMLINSKEILEELFGKVDSFCYPFGEYNEFIANKVKKVYKVAFATSLGGNNLIKDRYMIRRMTPEEYKRMIGVAF